CGFKPGSNGPDYGLPTFKQVLADIKVSTNRHIDLVVVTHEHQDHVNGFWSKSDPYFADISVDKVWFAWTGRTDAGIAKEPRRRHHAQLVGLLSAFNALSAAGSDGTQRLRGLLELEMGMDEPNLHAIADPSASINKQAMALLKEKAGKSGTRYINP